MTEENLGKEIGKVISYFSHVEVAAIKLSKVLKVGEKIRIKGATTDFEVEVDSMQINNKAVEKGKKSDDIGIKVSEKVRPNDKVYKLG